MLDPIDFAIEEKFVVFNISLGHRLRVYVVIRKAEHLFLICHLIAVQDGLTGYHGSSLAVLGEKIIPGNLVENPMKQSPGRNLVEPCISFGSEFAEGFLRTFAMQYFGSNDCRI